MSRQLRLCFLLKQKREVKLVTNICEAFREFMSSCWAHPTPRSSWPFYSDRRESCNHVGSSWPPLRPSCSNAVCQEGQGDLPLKTNIRRWLANIAWNMGKDSKTGSMIQLMIRVFTECRRKLRYIAVSRNPERFAAGLALSCPALAVFGELLRDSSDWSSNAAHRPLLAKSCW